MPPPRSSRRFPLRTLVLMILAVAAFFWMWVRTHQYRNVSPGKSPVEVLPVPLVPPTHPKPDK